MERYDYEEAVKDDIRDYIKEHDIKVTADNKDEIYEELYGNMFVSDSVTGIASGSYTFNAWQAEENLCHNTELLGEALHEFGDDGSYLEKGAEACDVTIRCYLLSGCLQKVLDELKGGGEE